MWLCAAVWYGEQSNGKEVYWNRPKYEINVSFFTLSHIMTTKFSVSQLLGISYIHFNSTKYNKHFNLVQILLDDPVMEREKLH